ncbi:murein hydrolase activator EnvC family protein [Acidobacteriota bacterium]
MKNLRTKNILIPLMLFLGLVLIQVPSHSLQEVDVTAYQKRLQDIGKQIDQIEKAKSKREKRKNSIQAQLETIGLNKLLSQKKIDLYNTRLQKANSDLRQTQNDITALGKKLDTGREEVAKVLITLYKFGELSYFGFLFEVKDVGSLITENKNLNVLAKAQQNILQDYINTETELERSRDNLKNKKQEISDLLSNAKTERQELGKQENQNQALIRKINQDKALYEQRLAELQVRHKEMQDLLKQLLTQESTMPFAPAPLYEKRGNLEWPIAGRIISSFGTKRHPQFQTKTVNYGIEIAPQTDIVVKAVHPGLVKYSDDMESFGNVIILDHGMKYYTIYGHCAELWVEEGQFVKTGQAIGSAGDIGSLEGKSLYFAIRARDTFLDPLQWLRQK